MWTEKEIEDIYDMTEKEFQPMELYVMAGDSDPGKSLGLFSHELGIAMLFHKSCNIEYDLYFHEMSQIFLVDHCRRRIKEKGENKIVFLFFSFPQKNKHKNVFFYDYTRGKLNFNTFNNRGIEVGAVSFKDSFRECYKTVGMNLINSLSEINKDFDFGGDELLLIGHHNDVDLAVDTAQWWGNRHRDGGKYTIDSVEIDTLYEKIMKKERGNKSVLASMVDCYFELRRWKNRIVQ